MSQLFSKLTKQFPDYDFKQDHLLAPYTTVKIGGPAEVFYQAKDQQKFENLLSFVKENHLPVTVLGWGANVLVSDKGVDGLVIKNKAGKIKVLGNNNQDKKTVKKENSQKILARWNSDQTKGTFKYEFNDLDYDESDQETVLVEIDAGVSLNQAIVSLINQGITGLQWYARIPSTIGGAVFNNIHGGTHFLSEVIESVRVMDEQGQIKELSKDELSLGYDQSRFHHSNELILSVQFSLYKGDTDKAKNVVQEWSRRKSIQPHNSLGCTFKNISNDEKEELGYPTTSVGYIIEYVLGMKGYRQGDAQVSDYHCAFIENKGQATANDYLNIIKTIIKQTKLKTGLIITPEIFFLGFDKSELEGIVSSYV
ncbi:MAG: FAD-binding protein [Candidatus Pacebacteria bacterium]|nr:FAD-binding protein [Candidatus Paceibacterota bacterium]